MSGASKSNPAQKYTQPSWPSGADRTTPLPGLEPGPSCVTGRRALVQVYSTATMSVKPTLHQQSAGA